MVPLFENFRTCFTTNRASYCNGEDLVGIKATNRNQVAHSFVRVSCSFSAVEMSIAVKVSCSLLRPQEHAAYISQYNFHVPEMTVRETIDFFARCQGVESRKELLAEVSRREKQAGYIPEANVDAYMKAISINGLEKTLQTNYILKDTQFKQ